MFFKIKFLGLAMGMSKAIFWFVIYFGLVVGEFIVVNLGLDKGALTKIILGGEAFGKASLKSPIKCWSLLFPVFPPKMTPTSLIPFLSTEAIKLNPEASIYPVLIPSVPEYELKRVL